MLKLTVEIILKSYLLKSAVFIYYIWGISKKFWTILAPMDKNIGSEISPYVRAIDALFI